MRFKSPKFTDQHRYQNGYRQAVDTDIRRTFERVKKQNLVNQKEIDEKVKILPNWRFKEAK